MTPNTTHLAPADIFVSGDATPEAPEPTVEELEWRGVRHGENYAGLRKTEAYHRGEIARFDAELVQLNAQLTALPATAGPIEVYEAKNAINTVERDRGLAVVEVDLLLPQIDEELSRAAATEGALVAARAKLP